MSKASLAASVLKFIPLASFRWNTTIWLADTTIHTGIAVDEVFYLCFHTFHTILSLIKHVQTNSANYGHTLISYKHVKLWGTYQFHSVLVIRHQDHQHFFLPVRNRLRYSWLHHTLSDTQCLGSKHKWMDYPAHFHFLCVLGDRWRTRHIPLKVFKVVN